MGSETAEPLLARLFALPRLRSDQAPTPPLAWPVANLLQPPVEAAAPLKLLAPADHAEFIAVSGTTTIHPRANRAGGLT